MTTDCAGETISLTLLKGWLALQHKDRLDDALTLQRFDMQTASNRSVRWLP